MLLSNHVQIPSVIHNRVLKALLSCRSAITPSKRTAISRSLLYLEHVKFYSKLPPQWRRFVVCENLISVKMEAILPSNSSISPSLPRRPLSFIICCHTCNTPREAKFLSLYRSGKWKSVPCRVCCISMSCKQWLCVCGIPWHSCDVHANNGFSCSSKLRSKKTISTRFLTPTPGYSSNILVRGLSSYASLRPLRRRKKPQKRMTQDSNLAVIASVKRLRSVSIPLSVFGIHPG